MFINNIVNCKVCVKTYIHYIYVVGLRAAKAYNLSQAKVVLFFRHKYTKMIFNMVKMILEFSVRTTAITHKRCIANGSTATLAMHLLLYIKDKE